ncbi:MAG: hypothetical protein OEV55_05875 [candidate division Zixibacteria bacterium]|nr:hypothetical protein [candidate division Zixibacteria bacterium]
MITRKMTIIAQDPSIKDSKGKILRSRVDIPYEKLGPGPRGFRVHIVDYDSSQQVLYRPLDHKHYANQDKDPFENVPDDKLLQDPGFHAQNVYAIIMRLLSRFEAALGRRISWGFGFHQLHATPHAFAEANAYYSEDAQGLFFGYFPVTKGEIVYTCLSHDIIAHETTHALLDGLRDTYTVPSGPDQAGFHEGFSDVVALLSVFGLSDVVKALLSRKQPESNYIQKNELQVEALRKSVLLGLAEQFGKEISRHRADCLRRAVVRKPRIDAQQIHDFEESHIRGEILSAAVLNSFIQVWRKRLESWLPNEGKAVAVDRVVEDGCDAANHLLTMCIRALDYCPVVDITFDDFLSALLTADFELLPDDGKYKYREELRKEFKLWGIEPASGTKTQFQKGEVPELGIWKKPSGESEKPLDYECVHRESLQQDKNEVFRFLWENRESLKIFENAYTWVISLRPCMRLAPDGFALKETVAEYRQTLDIQAGQLRSVCKDMEKPKGMPDSTQIRLNGGGVLVFDDFGHLKYHIHSRIDDPDRQNKRLEYLWRNRIIDSKKRYGFSDGSPEGQRFARMHLRRDRRIEPKEEWEDE